MKTFLSFVALVVLGGCQTGIVTSGRPEAGGGDRPGGPSGSGGAGGAGGAGGSGGASGAGGGGSGGGGARDSGGGGSPGDGAAPEGGGPPGGSCADDEWPQYQHDANRTGTSRACIKEPLAVAWKYTPTPEPASWPYRGMVNYIAAEGKLFVQYRAKRPESIWVEWYMDGLDLAGKKLWLWYACKLDGLPKDGRDSGSADWPAYGLGMIANAEDGLCFIKASTGEPIYWIEDWAGSVFPIEDFDYWGQVLHDGKRTYAFNTIYGDGPPSTLRAYAPTGSGDCRGCGKRLWSAFNNACGTVFGCGDSLGGLALEDGTLFYTSRFAGGAPVPAGLYAVDAATGKKKWNVPASFSSHISSWGGRVYGVDGSDLVAFSASDGARLWAKSVGTVGGQAPVIAPGGRIILATSDGVKAFDGASGAPLWMASVPGSVVTATGYHPLNAGGKLNATSVAVAGGNGAVVVTGSAGVTLLDLDTGKPRWSGGGVGAVKNPIITGSLVIVTDGQQAIALKGP